MATKSFNPFQDAYTSLNFIIMMLPIEARMQAVKPTAVIKKTLDKYKELVSDYATLLGQNEVLRQQIIALQAEITALQFTPQPDIEDKKKGRKQNANG